VLSRVLHFVAYLTAQTHDVRATFWTIGSVILIFPRASATIFSTE